MTFIPSSINTLKSSLKNSLVQAVGLIILVLLIINLCFSQIDSIVRGWTHDLGTWLFPQSEDTTEIQNLIIAGLQEMDDLTTFGMTEKATIKKSQDRKISRLKVGDTTLIYEGVGKVQAGINMKNLTAKNLDYKHHKIHIILPPPYLADIYLDIDSSRKVDQYKRWWGPNVEAQLQEKAQKEALAQIKAESCANGILDKANEHAQTLLKDIFTKAGFQDIIIDTQNPQKGSCKVV